MRWLPSWLRRWIRWILSPYAVAPIGIGLEIKRFARSSCFSHRHQRLMQGLPLFILQLIHRGCQPTSGQLSGQCGTNPLISLLKSFLERDRNQAQPFFPTFEPLRFVRSMSLKRWRWAVIVASADRTNPGLMVAHLSSGSDDASSAHQATARLLWRPMSSKTSTR